MIEILFGIVSGIVSSLGMGGGSILIVLLSVFTNYSQKNIQGINLIFFIPTAIVAILLNLKRKNIDLKLTAIFSVLGIIGAIVGSFIAININDITLKNSFIIFLIIITIYETYGFYKKYIKR